MAGVIFCLTVACEVNRGLHRQNLVVNRAMRYYIGLFAGSCALATFALSLHVPWDRARIIGALDLVFLVLNLVLPPIMRPGHLLLPSLFLPSPPFAAWLSVPLLLALGSLLAIRHAANQGDVFLWCSA